MVEVIIDSVRKGIINEHHHVVLLKEVAGQRYLPVWIQAYPAEHLVRMLKEEPTPRPSTFDLMKTLTDLGGFQLDHIVIHQVQEEVYYATLAIKLGDASTTLEVDSRPSDALNLALLAGAPMFVADGILVQNGITFISSGQERNEPTNERLQRTELDKILRDTVLEDIPPESMRRVRLRQILVANFSQSELYDLSFDLGIDYEVLSTQSKGDFARELVMYFQRREQLVKLEEAVRRLRPSIVWNQLGV